MPSEEKILSGVIAKTIFEFSDQLFLNIGWVSFWIYRLQTHDIKISYLQLNVLTILLLPYQTDYIVLVCLRK